MVDAAQGGILWRWEKVQQTGFAAGGFGFLLGAEVLVVLIIDGLGFVAEQLG